jgi:hypothetical protein
LIFAIAAGGATQAAIADTWSGTWARGELVTGNLILEQTGSTVTGHYTWNDGSGRVWSREPVSGATFTGGFNETNYEGTFVLTFCSATPRPPNCTNSSATHFGGTFSGVNKNTNGPISGPFTGTCIAGPRA